MHKLNLFVLTLLFTLSVVAASPRELKQAKIKRGDDGYYQPQPNWGNKHKPSKTPSYPTTTPCPDDVYPTSY